VAKLNQIIAIANGKKNACQAALTNLYKTLQRVDAFQGFDRQYQPLDDEGENLPSERRKVQHTVAECVSEATDQWDQLLDIIATQEYANCSAKADVVVDGQTVLSEVPVSYMLFLEKRLDDIKSFVSKLPTLSTDVDWETSMSDDRVYVAEPVETHRTKKVPKTLVKSEATQYHPAQVDVFTEDVLVGYWKKIDSSGAIPMTKQREILKRVDILREAVKMAREEANGMQVNDVKVGSAVTKFVFG